jgi:hypothetical protein
MKYWFSGRQVYKLAMPLRRMRILPHRRTMLAQKFIVTRKYRFPVCAERLCASFRYSFVAGSQAVITSMNIDGINK